MRMHTFIPQKSKPLLRKIYQNLMEKSIKIASVEQKLKNLADKLIGIVPDLTFQYSTFQIDNTYTEVKTRNQHAFQISLVDEIIGEFENPTIVDIGDSSGTHIQYIMGLYDSQMECLSVNLDPQAVEKIKQKGLKAVNARAEELHKYNLDVDIFLCFEMLEHLLNPCLFLHELYIKTKAKYLVITVPYVRQSRVGLYHIRNGKELGNVYAENTHLFELNPSDWKLLAKHSGWNVSAEKVYLQYPKKNALWLTKSLWKRFDFEGFYGMILTRDGFWSSKYMDW